MEDISIFSFPFLRSRYHSLSLFLALSMSCKPLFSSNFKEKKEQFHCLRLYKHVIKRENIVEQSNIHRFVFFIQEKRELTLSRQNSCSFCFYPHNDSALHFSFEQRQTASFFCFQFVFESYTQYTDMVAHRKVSFALICICMLSVPL